MLLFVNLFDSEQSSRQARLKWLKTAFALNEKRAINQEPLSELLTLYRKWLIECGYQGRFTGSYGYVDSELIKRELIDNEHFP